MSPYSLKPEAPDSDLDSVDLEDIHADEHEIAAVINDVAEEEKEVPK